MPDAYLSSIASDLGLHPKSLYALKRQRVEREAFHPEPSVVLPDGKELYDDVEYKAWYLREVAGHWSARGSA